MKEVKKKGQARLFGVDFFGGTRSACLQEVAKRLKSGAQTAVYTPNPIMLENAVRDPSFCAALRRADMNLPDGIGVLLAAKLLGEDMAERISGVDMAKDVLGLAAREGYRVFLLGGRRGVAAEAARRLGRELPALCLCGVRDGYFGESELGGVLEEIQGSHADILFVCLGSPKQEIWIDRNREKLPEMKLFMALGGTLDVLARRVRRAPIFVQNLGLEWLWRMANEPRRLRELPKLVSFSGRVLLEATKKLVILHRADKQKVPF